MSDLIKIVGDFPPGGPIPLFVERHGGGGIRINFMDTPHNRNMLTFLDEADAVRLRDGLNALLPPRIFVACEGGVVQGAVSDSPIAAEVIDYDTDGTDGDRLSAIPQFLHTEEQCGTADACVGGLNVLCAPEQVALIAAAIKEGGAK